MENFKVELQKNFSGGLAQLGERHAGSVEVKGSNPLSSTFFIAEEYQEKAE